MVCSQRSTGLPFSADLDGEIMRQHIRFLMRHAAGFRRRHIGAIANGVNIVPFGLQRFVVDANTGFALGQTAIEQHLRRPVRRHHDQQIVGDLVIVQTLDDLFLPDRWNARQTRSAA